MNGYVNNKNYISLDNVCELVAVEVTEGERGTEKREYSKREVFCSFLPINSQEFHSAGQRGIKSAVCVVVDVDFYNNEELIEFEEKQYKVYRRYPRPDGLVELYCEERVENY